MYVAGIVLFSIRYSIDLMRLFMMIRKNSKEESRDYTLVYMDKSVPPFSFFRYIFVNLNDIFNNRFHQFILRHELAHIRAWHSIDRLFIGLGQVIQWFNPLILLYKKAIIAQHEFAADHAVLSGETALVEYQQNLMKYAYEKNQLRLTSNLSDTIIHKRLHMINRQKKGSLSAFRAIAATVMAAFLLLAFSSGDKVKVKSYEADNTASFMADPAEYITLSSSGKTEDTTRSAPVADKDSVSPPDLDDEASLKTMEEELEKMETADPPDPEFYFPLHEPCLRPGEFLYPFPLQPLPLSEENLRALAEEQRQLAERHLRFADREQLQKLAEEHRNWAEDQRRWAEEQRNLAEQLKPLLKGQQFPIDTADFGKYLNSIPCPEHYESLMDDITRQYKHYNVPPPESRFMFPEWIPFHEDLLRDFSLRHLERNEELKALEEKNEKLQRKHEEWQEKYRHEMEKQREQMEEKRKQLMEEYHQMMKKYRDENYL